jgi:ABC-type glycerol-3-phosphate transport system substrate-binding protein
MRKTRMILLAGAALAGLAGCNALPSDPTAASDAPYSANGVWVGSGDGEAAETSSASTASDSTAQRGGHGFGSGN